MSHQSTVKKGNSRPFCMGITDWTNRLLGLLSLSATFWSNGAVGDGNLVIFWMVYELAIIYQLILFHYY